MPSERSYPDRHARAVLLQTNIAGFSPAFAPADASLSAANFLAFCGLVEVANDAVGNSLGAWRVLVEERQEMVKTMKATATRVLAYLKSSAAFAGRLKTATAAANKLRGVTPKKPKAPAEPPPGEPAKSRNSGNQSYGDIAQYFKALIVSVTGLAGYAPAPAGNPITLSNLSGTLSNYRSKNEAILPLEVTWRDKVGERALIFDGKNGLRDKMTAVKNAVKAQYGQSSPEYGDVKGIKL